MKKNTWSSRLRRIGARRLTLGLVLFTIFWNEYLSYSLSALLWPRIFSVNSESEYKAVILFVADPQLQGWHDEDLHAASSAYPSLAIYDADRYLQRGFSRAYSHVRPGMVVFLGDLVDEGSDASSSEYAGYVTRFHSIFQTDPGTEKIYISGDNDVGGENFLDPKEDWKVERFNKAFPSDIFTTYKFIDFIKVGIDWRDRFNENKERELRALRAESGDDRIRILLNHMTMLDTMDVRAAEIMAAHIVISAHIHEANLLRCPERHLKTTQQGVHMKECKLDMTHIADSRVYRLDLAATRETLLELMVPTCSYRMGVSHVGYAAAVIHEGGEMKVTVLWLPSRYPQLYLYIIVGVLVGMLTLAELCRYFCRRFKLCS